MLFRIPHSTFRILILVALSMAFVQPIGAQADPAADLLARINTLRTQSGLLPLAISPQLTAAAQGHSHDMATTGNIDHTGSDGSTIETRLRASGYGHWRGFGIWGENIYGGQTATVDVAWNFWINSQVHRSNLLNTRYREIGIGVATSDNGTFFTLNFGAQPNVLPFFVTGSPPDVTLLLTNENDITTGEGVAVMGQATEVRAGESTDLRNVPWQPWAQTIPLHLSNAPGSHTITVEYRDDLKRGTKYTQAVDVSSLSTATPITPSPTATTGATSTPRATATPAPTQVITGTLLPSPTATSRATDTPTPQPTDTPHSTSTATPLPTSTPTIAATPTIEATATPTIPATIIHLSPSPTMTAQAIAAVFPTSFSASRLTPPAPRPAPTERPLIALMTGAPDNVIVAVCGLQVVAVIIGVIVVAVRVRRRRDA
jgi:hypothetical protein